MNNYTVDASIYSLPNVDVLPLEIKVKKYQEFISRIAILDSILKPEKNNIKLYFSRQEINLLRKEKKLLTKDKYNEIKRLGITTHQPIDYLLDSYTTLIEELLLKGFNGKDSKYSKCKTIESHFCISSNDIEYESIAYTPGVEKNNVLPSSKSFEKKMLFLAFLNRHIYYDSRANRIIMRDEISGNRTSLTANVKNISHQFIIDEIPKNNFVINEQAIEICKLDEYNIRKSFSTIEKTFSQAKKEFSNTLDFINTADKSIEEYTKTMECIKNKKFDAKIKLKIDKHITECPNTLYDHLDSLDMLVKYYNFTKMSNDMPINKRKPIMEKYIKIKNNKDTCYLENESICKKCCAFLAFCGYDCSGEKQEKIIDGKKFRIHLKPYSYNKEGENKLIADLTLRIYFRWDNEKIQVGYIGKHL